jgi:glutamate racemase
LQFFNKTAPIGIFDSGIGGLTVVKRIISMFPNENIVYFGDTARVPYGTKSNSTVIEYAIQDTRFLINKNVKLIIVACNTASSVALQQLKTNFNIPVIGMINPGAKLALKKTKNKRIGVIGTNATINNKAYSNELKKLDNSLSVFEKACPLFVPLAEEGWLNHKATKLIAEEYLSELIEKEIDTLILGCTHYPLLAEIIQEVVGNNVTLIDSGYAASLEVENYLEGRGIRNDSNQYGTHHYYVSDLPNRFKPMAERFLGNTVNRIEKVDVDFLTKTD